MGFGFSKAINSMITAQSTNIPVAVVLGATGVGKSKLAIELARHFNGEILSADSMQIYKGLDIVTNKVTPEEQRQATHHFISCTDSLKRYTVVDFQSQALPVIHTLFNEKKLPIIVGGTNYYIESLLWDVLMKPEVHEKDTLMFDADERNLQTEKKNEHPSSEDSSACCDSNYVFQQPITADSFRDIESHLLHKVLIEVDPSMAVTLHPNDKRKIIRSLQVYQQHNTRHSDLITEQKSKAGGSSLGGPLRFKNCVMFWLQCNKEVLDERVNDRVDKMIEQGLISELLDFHKTYNESRLTENLQPKYTEGIFQSIGFKEFHEYLILSEVERNSEGGQKILRYGIEDMKLHTRQYIKKQNRWITNRFLKVPDRELPPVFGLDATHLETWNESVLQTAIHIVKSKLQNKECDIAPLPVMEAPEDHPGTFHCEVCDRVFVGSRHWQIHISSKTHRRREMSVRKKAKTLANS